jgi:hypothetical protein
MSSKPSFAVNRPSWVKAQVSRPGSRGLRIWLLYMFACLLSVPVLQFLSRPHVPAEQQLLAFLLFFLCTRPVAAHLAQPATRLPVFPIICLVYGVCYALPVFFVEPMLVSSVAVGGFSRVSDSDTMHALELALLGVGSMQIGFVIFRFSVVNLLIPRSRLRLDAKKAKRLVICLGALGMFILWLSVTGRLDLPPELFYIAVLIQKLTSLSIGLLYLYYLKGDLTIKEKIWLIFTLVVTEILSISSSNFRMIIDPAVVVGAVYWMVKQKFPWKYFAIGALVFAIMQPVKSEFRYRVWKHGYAGSSITGRLQLWGELVGAGWLGAIHGERGAVTDTTRGALSRTDIVHMFGRVLSMTPRYVPFQLGKTYSYLIYALVPRALWPGKPSSQAANSFFGVTYNFQDQKTVGETSIGIPHLVESYINFDVLGVFFIMMLIGMVYAAVDRLFNHLEAGEGAIVIYSVIMTTLWTIETGTAATFGAVIQTIMFYTLIFHFVREPRHRAGVVTTTPAANAA